jgi:leucyl aminopeptidase
MQFTTVAGPAARHRNDCTIVGIHAPRELTAAAAELDQRSRGRVTALLKRGDFSARAGETRLLDGLPGVAGKRVLLVGLGPRKKYDARAYRRACAAAIHAASQTGAHDCDLWLAQASVTGLAPYYAGRAAAEAALSSLYRIPDLKTGKKPPLSPLKRIALGVQQKDAREAARGLKDGAGIAEGTRVARDLGNLPPNVCTPRYLAKTARELADEHKSLSVQVHDERAIAKLKMGAFLSVTRGSQEPPRLIVMQYKGGGSSAPIALVGKGITFDSGGISIKPGAAMDEMKFDMCGAASVIGAFAAVAALKLPVNLVGIVLACENLPSGTATKPGDIVTSMSGQTIEVLNTDAEGRLILADGLTYVRRFNPATVIDIATLTGACVIALGNQYAGLMCDDAELTAELKSAGERAGDGAWPMPMGEAYADQLKSNFADMANIGGREGGAITAACFLGKFTAGLRWAHLDIAGVAWLSGEKKGATGRPVPLLLDFLLQQAQNKPKKK